MISGQLDVAGTYTLTSTTANAPSHAPAGDRHTAFTGALLRALDDADSLTLDQIYVTVDRDLAARNLPRPQRRAVNTASNLALSRGPATRSHTKPPDSDMARFTRTYHPLIGAGMRVFGGKDAHVRELIVDRSGLIIRRTLVRTYLPWRDIVQVGVLQLERGSSNQRGPAAQRKRKHVLVVRLRPEVAAPGVVSVLSDEHRQLGYLGLCTVEGLGSSRQEITSALEQFAGGKLVHNSRQFLDRDPRLRPEMV